MGYPNWLFYFMFLFGICNCISSMLDLTFGENVVSHCYYNANIGVRIMIEGKVLEEIPVWGAINNLFFTSWDVTTLFLFLWKIRTFLSTTKNEIQSVHQRIKGIMYKIAIITIFYQLIIVPMTLFANVYRTWVNPGDFRWMLWLTNVTTSLSLSYSMYLMMDHNKTHFVKFLKCIDRLKLDWICCYCCRYGC